MAAPTFCLGLPQKTVTGSDAGLFSSTPDWDGSILYALEGNDEDELGSAVVGMGDINNDMFDDFAVGAAGNPFSETAFVKIYSGMDGSVMFTLLPDFGIQCR